MKTNHRNESVRKTDEAGNISRRRFAVHILLFFPTGLLLIDHGVSHKSMIYNYASWPVMVELLLKETSYRYRYITKNTN